MADDGTIDTPTPQDVLAAQQAQIQQGVGSASPFQRNSAIGTMLGRTLFGNPQLQQANAIQNGLKQGASGVGTQQGGESDVDYTLRKLKAQRDAVADISPQLAAQLNTQILTLGQKKFENSRLMASDARQQTLFEEEQPAKKAEAANAIAQNKTYVVAPDDISKQGYKVQSFDMTDPTQSAAYQAASAVPGATTISAAKAGELFTKSDVQSQKFQLALAKAQVTAGQQLDDGALRQLAVESVLNPSALSRQPAAARNQIASFKFNNGISPADEQSARTEIVSLNAAARTIGSREGSLSILQNSLKGFGDQVLSTLNGVDRGSYTAINSGVAAGKRFAGSGPEARYAAAIQSFVSDYARVISGGGSVTSDSARDEAHALLSKADSPEAVKAVVDQLANKELSVVLQAGNTALETLAHPQKYRALLKIQQRAGIPLTGEDAGSTYGAPAGPAPAPGPNTGAPVAAPPGAAPPQANNVDALVSKYLPKQ